MQARNNKASKLFRSPERAEGQRIIKIGFDFDGVLFYNPTRIIRPFTSLFRRLVLGQKETRFYIPKHPVIQKIGALLHRTSFTPNTGFADFISLTKNKRFEVYVITARPSFVKENLEQLFKKHGAGQIAKIYQNIADEQPHLYKERLIKKLNLDFFVEDNWDIVDHLTKNTKAKVVWIYNIADKFFIKHFPKAPNVKEALKRIQELLK